MNVSIINDDDKEISLMIFVLDRDDVEKRMKNAQPHALTHDQYEGRVRYPNRLDIMVCFEERYDPHRLRSMNPHEQFEYLMRGVTSDMVSDHGPELEKYYKVWKD